MRKFLFPALALAVLAFPAPGASAMEARDPLVASLGADIASPAYAWPADSLAAALKSEIEHASGAYADELKSFYAERNYASLWLSSGRWTERAKEMIARLEQAQRDGLDPKDYLKPVFFSAEQLAGNEAQQAKAELDLSAAAIAFVRHLSQGRLDPSRISSIVFASPREFSGAKVLREMADAADLPALLDSYQPPHAGYRLLRQALVQALEKQEAIASAQPIPSGPVISAGMHDTRVPMLRARLALNGNSDAPQVMDARLVAAVRSFQEENGLVVTGEVGAQTLRALNEKTITGMVRASIPDLIVNMERWRWLPRDLGDLYVMVNVPEFVVRVREGEKTSYEGRVVVGKPDTPTPLFSNSMEYIVVNPSWNVPPSIVRKEMLPLLMMNPEEFIRRGIEVRQDGSGNLSFRQPPSERNALGRIKFMFPNQHDVYLHDTPAKGYFERSYRAFSHGCVRVDKPLRFADALFVREPQLSSERLVRLFGGAEQFLYLKHKIPVHLVYFTAFAASDGGIETRDDLYGLDGRLKSLLGLKKRS